MPPLSVLIKPASSLCNLRCRYCFYYDLSNNRDVKSYGIMTVEDLETLVKKAFDYAEGVCTFAFQGGEPTIAGLDFFKQLMVFEKKYNVNNIQVNNALQTNGTLITEEWAKFLHDNNFLVGVSIDGPKDINDLNRVDENAKSVYPRIMDTIKLFNKYKVEYNVLSVVSAANAKHAKKVYKFYKANDFRYVQIIACLDPLLEVPGKNKYSLTPKLYATFLKDLFDAWYEDVIKGEGISIRRFDNLIGMLMGYPAEECGMLGRCQCEFVIEADGGVYPCDFYVNDEWLMGNFKDKSFKELRESENAQRFIDVSLHVDPNCKTCPYAPICKGGCRRTREPFQDGKPSLNYFCPAFKEFYGYALPKLQDLAARLRRNMNQR